MLQRGAPLSNTASMLRSLVIFAERKSCTPVHWLANETGRVEALAFPVDDWLSVSPTETGVFMSVVKHKLSDKYHRTLQVARIF
jgi:hypothetical protein